MVSTYRRRRDTWHFCSNCFNWPTSDYVERDSKPTTGELCDQCEAKQRNNNCRSTAVRHGHGRGDPGLDAAPKPDLVWEIECPPERLRFYGEGLGTIPVGSGRSHNPGAAW